MVKTFNANGATYKTTTTEVRGNIYAITEVTGRFNYINVRKVSNNPFGMSGTDFPTWEDAGKKYTSPEMKTALLLAELNITTS